MEYEKRKHNAPIATVIKNYLDKKGGKVSKARDEIKYRFFALDWRYQKKILPAFLCSCKSDRDWASRQMFTHWDNSFIPIVKEMWENYHEVPLSWVVIRYLPIDYIKKNMDILSAGRNYFFICKRLIDDSEFRVDKERLYESDYLSLLILQKCEILPVVAWGLFYTQIRKICLGEYKVRIDDLTFYSERGTDVISIFNCPIVKSMLYTINRDLNMPELYKQLNRWIDDVSEDVMKSRGWFLLNYCGLTSTARNKIYLLLMRKYCYEHLDSPFKVKGESVYTKDLDELMEDLEVIATIEDLGKNKMATSSLIDLVSDFQLVKTGDCPF